MRTFVLSFLILTANISFGQVNFGVKGGGNLASVKKHYDHEQSRVGYFVGGMVSINLTKNLFIQPELLYSSKGFKYEAHEEQPEITHKFNYLNLPIMVGIRPTENFSILLGPELGVLTRATAKSDNSTFNTTQVWDRFDIGIGLGVDCKILREFGINLRYNYGLKSLATIEIIDANKNVMGISKLNAHRVLQFGAFYLIPNKKTKSQ